MLLGFWAARRGRRVAARLRAGGFAVRAASRSGAVRFDWSDPATWEAAVAGTARMYLMAPHELPVDPSFVRFAVDHGVRHIVLLSSRGIEAMGDERLLAAERTVREAGADWTILRPDWFNQNFDGGFFGPAVRRASSRCRWVTSARRSWTPTTSPRSRRPPSPGTATPAGATS
jgi:uncharacterized protein YbjT (DUF2867 family)